MASTLCLENLELSLISRSLRELPRPELAVCHAVIDYCGACRLEMLSEVIREVKVNVQRLFSDKSLFFGICVYYYESTVY